MRPRLLAVEEGARMYGDASAAVAVLLREREGLEVLVMERAKRQTDPWSGHWSFPGGRRQKGESLLSAACRETEEEIGVAPDPAEAIGCMAARAPANRPELLVLPFVFRWMMDQEPRLGPEVASTAWVPLWDLRSTRATATIRIRDRDVRMPAFVEGSRAVWGFTYRLLEDLLALLPRVP